MEGLWGIILCPVFGLAALGVIVIVVARKEHRNAPPSSTELLEWQLGMLSAQRDSGELSEVEYQAAKDQLLE